MKIVIPDRPAIVNEGGRRSARSFWQFLTDILDFGVVFATRDGARLGASLEGKIEHADQHARTLDVAPDEHAALLSTIASQSTIWAPPIARAFERAGFYEAIEKAEGIQ